MFNKILVATDGSDYSRHALTAALEYAKLFHSEIELLHVVLQPMYYAGVDMQGRWFPYTEAQIKEIGLSVLKDTRENIDTGDTVIKEKVLVGHPATVIIEESKDDFDLLIIGTRGRSQIESLILGSVTHRVLADIKCPVLVVK